MNSTRPDIGIWGPTGAGKTTYLAGLTLALDKFHPDWTMWPGESDLNAERFLSVDTARIAEGHFPAPNEVGQPLLYTFRLWRKDTGWGRFGRYHEVAMIDAAGELVFDGEDGYGYFGTLRQCKGILCMVDPESGRERGRPGPIDSRESYFTLVNRLAYQLAREDGLTAGGKLKTHLAFCVTKIDLDRYWGQRQNVQALMRQILGERTYDRIHAVCDPGRVKFFATSVVGRYQSPDGRERPNLEPAGDHYRIADLRHWAPYGSLEPLFWLFDCIEKERDAKLPAWRRAARGVFREPNYRGS